MQEVIETFKKELEKEIRYTVEQRYTGKTKYLEGLQFAYSLLKEIENRK